MWGWADPDEEFPEAVVAAGRALGDYGREHELPALYEPETRRARTSRWTASA